MIKLSIIIISYNTRELTLECLESLYKETKTIDYEVIIVDNNSSDQSAEAIEKWCNRVAIAEQFPIVKLIALSENRGFAGANNLACENINSEYILLLNPDTVVLDNAIEKLLNFAQENPDNGIWGGRTLFKDGSLNPTSCWGKMTIWGLISQALALNKIFSQSSFFNPEGMGNWKRDTVREVDIVTGCFFLIRTSLWKKLNGFNPEFFMYGEEVDLCLRAKKIGAKPIITPNATIIHYGGASESSRRDMLIKLLKAKIHLIRCHWHTNLQKTGIFLFLLWPLSRVLALSLIVNIFKQNQYKEKLIIWTEVWQTINFKKNKFIL